MKKTIFLLSLLFIALPLTAYAWGINVDAERINDTANDRVVINFSNAPNNTAWIEIQQNNTDVYYCLPGATSGSIYLTSSNPINGYAIRWFDANGNRLAYINPIYVYHDTIINDRPLPYDQCSGGVNPGYPNPTDPTDPGGGDNNPPGGGNQDRPPKPSGLTVATGVTGSTGVARIGWQPTSGSSNISGYMLYCDGVLMHSSLLTDTSFVINDLSPGARHVIDLIAVDVHGNESIQATVVFYATDGDVYTEDTNNNLPPGGGGDDDNNPGNGGGDDGSCEDCEKRCTICEQIESVLDCPYWSDYMGEWTGAIVGAMPKPADYMDEFMSRLPSISDTLSRDMMDEFMGRLPQISDRISNDIADELQSREKRVSPPPSLPNAYDPGLPDLSDYDLDRKINENITDNVPDFTPDFSDSTPFIIQDPLQYTFPDEDLGYMDIKPEVNERDYNKIISLPDQDRGYQAPGMDTLPMPDYNKPPNNPGAVPDYSPPSNPGSSMPDYNAGDPGDMPDYNAGDPGDMPDYNAGDPGDMPDYNAGDPGDMPDYVIGVGWNNW